MKRIKGKYIRLTEEQLNKIVKDSVEKQLALIMEYKIPRQKYVDNVCALSTQILENWCLIHYCTLNGREETKTHWKNELWAHLDNIASKHIKGKDSGDTKRKAIIEAFEIEDLTDVELCANKIMRKFLTEKIDITQDGLIRLANGFVSDICRMITAIVEGFEGNAIHDYIESI